MLQPKMVWNSTFSLAVSAPALRGFVGGEGSVKMYLINCACWYAKWQRRACTSVNASDGSIEFPSSCMQIIESDMKTERQEGERGRRERGDEGRQTMDGRGEEKRIAMQCK